MKVLAGVAIYAARVALTLLLINGATKTVDFGIKKVSKKFK